MPKVGQPTQKSFKHTWFFTEWAAHFGKRQADAQRELGWSRAKASDVWAGQRYTQALIEEAAPWLNLRPYELLMSPSEAMELRRFRAAAVSLAHSAEKPEERQPSVADIWRQDEEPAKRPAKA